MPWKTQVLLDYDQKGEPDATTLEIVKLPQGLYSSICIRLSGTGGAGPVVVDDLIATCKLKTDKGYVWDMRSADMRKMSRALTGRIPAVTDAVGAFSQTNQFLYFGRYPRDKAYMLDLTTSNVRQLELTFGTLVAAAGFATGTVVLTITTTEWVGTKPAEFRGGIGWREVANLVTGTGRINVDLLQGFNCPGLFIDVGTVTTVRQCTLGDKKLTVIFGQANFQDLLNIHNSEFYGDTPETLDVLWRSWDWKDLADTPVPALSMLSDPAFYIERGATTTTVRVVQGIIF